MRWEFSAIWRLGSFVGYVKNNLKNFNVEQLTAGIEFSDQKCKKIIVQQKKSAINGKFSGMIKKSLAAKELQPIKITYATSNHPQ